MTVNCWKLGREQLIREYRGTAIQKGSYACLLLDVYSTSFCLENVRYVGVNKSDI
jgi:hypothetical protein